MDERVKVLFASCAPNLLEGALATAASIRPDLPLLVVSESSPAAANLHTCRSLLAGKRVEIAIIVLQPQQPHWRLRLLALLVRPRCLVAINTSLDYFDIHPHSAGTILRHVFPWLPRPAPASTPPAFTVPRPVRMIGFILALLKGRQSKPGAPLPLTAPDRPPGISVVIPSRNGRDMLARMLPAVVRELQQGEIIVVDNGSEDGTADFLRQSFPGVRLLHHVEPLFFAKAVNVGVRAARFSHVCLLNNDMAVAPGFFEHLLGAFTKVPDLFCANPQVFLPPGVRREETGKSVIRSAPTLDDFPIRSDFPVEGEDLTYVLYGSSGCSLFDAKRLLALQSLDEHFQPAYVEDLDLGVRAWQQGWPTVFVARAQVVHDHRATMSRLYSKEQLDYMVVHNWLLFLARTVRDREVFLHYWRHTIERLARAADGGSIEARKVFDRIGIAGKWHVRRPPAVIPDREILALCNGSVSVFPGAAADSDRPVALIASPSFSRIRDIPPNCKPVLVVCAEPGPPPENWIANCAEIVTVSEMGPSFRAALRQTIRKWQAESVQLESAEIEQYYRELIES